MVLYLKKMIKFDKKKNQEKKNDKDKHRKRRHYADNNFISP